MLFKNLKTMKELHALEEFGQRLEQKHVSKNNNPNVKVWYYLSFIVAMVFITEDGHRNTVKPVLRKRRQTFIFKTDYRLM